MRAEVVPRGALSGVAADEAARQHAVGGDADAELAHDRQDLLLDAAAEERVLDLQLRDRMDGGGAADRRDAHLREADVADVAGLHELRDRADGLLDRHRRIEARRLVEVDVVGAEALERVRQRGLDRGRAAVEAEVGAVRAALGAELHLDEDLRAIAALQRLAQEQLVVPHAVEVSGVKERDAGVEGGVDRGDRLSAISSAVSAGQSHAAEAEGGEGGAVLAEGAGLHPRVVSHRRARGDVSPAGSG
jgi:hypothetical protein